MKLAIVAPSPIPFGAGGAEKLWWGLVESIKDTTNYQCELIKIPIAENDFWSLIEAYKKFYELDLSHFDMVITGKYPGWMVQHPNHHVYMLHCLRGYYDCFHFMGLPEKYESDNSSVNSLLLSIRNGDVKPSQVFKELDKIKIDASMPEDLFSFPGAFSRELVHYFDNWAFQNVKRFSAISNTVANRKEYFPKGAEVIVNYPPSTLKGLYKGRSDYFFTASRLDNAKRIKMIIEAYLQTSTDIPLKIAGTGPLADEFVELSSHDSRIEFVGYVSDVELVTYYANAYAIIFVPYDEDYGLITIEAMQSEKPVLTFSDCGGVNEFVEHGVTGLVCEPIIELLAQNIDKLASNRDACAAMGKAAKNKVSKINWDNTIISLLEIKQSSEKRSSKKSTESFGCMGSNSDFGYLKKITVVSTYCFFPPEGGGQNRLFYLYKEMAKYMQVNIVCLAHESEVYSEDEVAPNLFQIRVPKNQDHAIGEWRIEEQAGIPVTDIAMITLYRETPLFLEKVLESIEDSDVVVTSHCYLFPMLKEISNKPIVHESHNVEYLLKQEMLKGREGVCSLLETLRECESRACRDSELTIVCAPDDAVKYSELYNYDSSKAVVVANGVDLGTVQYIDAKERKSLRLGVGVNDKKLAIFIGSWHKPNIESVEEIIKLAPSMPDYIFIIIGSVCGYFSSRTIPENVVFASVVSDEEKLLYLGIADVALNPMLTGSGTNLKMLDYMVAGVPVVTTDVGARGLSIPDGLVVVCEIGNFKSGIESALRGIDTAASCKYAKEAFNWVNIAKNYLKAFINISQ